MRIKRTLIGLGAAGLALLACLPLTAPGAGDPGAAPAPSGTPRRVKVLFLGDDGHHRPLDRARQVFAEMAHRGIDFTYTDRMSDLNPDTLARYDALLVFANVTRISPEQEKAVLDYVAAGHGYVPVHCASYCFLNSQPMTALTGGRFKNHGTGVFTETFVKPDHPVLQGLKPIESWDETYVHEMHNEQGREVLSFRAEGEQKQKEPYTWTRPHGQGRVFYTAWGHDERTWGNNDFQNLLERGVRWAAGDWALQPAPKPKPFQYAEANLPNYIAGARWGTVGEPIRVMQLPVTPEESMRHMVLPAGFDVKLYAAEPQVKKPIAMAWDERGRLWVAETFDYPNDLQPEGEGNDRITICEDTDGDGKADKFTVFADKLSIPTSICFANGGLVVAQAPHMLFFKDTDGDDKADERKILSTGWGTGDTHAGPSNLRYGLDGWVYGTVGYSNFRGEVGGQRHSFGQGAFRFTPDGSKMEFLGSTTNNTWGLGMSEEGHWFISTANRDPSFFLTIPNRYYEQVAGMRTGRLAMIADTARIWPITEKVRQVDQHGMYTAGAGHALYTARSLPREYWNRIAFIAEPTGHIVGQMALQPDGASFRARADFNLLASTDEWTSPIMAEVGPDGSVWVIDWYNYIVQHNPIPPGFEKGKGNAYVTPLRDKRHGRIYRLAWKDGKPSKAFDLSKASAAQLVEAIKSDNQLWRLHAQRLIVERGVKDAIPALIQVARDTNVDAVGLNAPAIHALWALHNLGALDGSNPDALAAARAALAHPSAGVRKAAVDVMPRSPESADAVITGKLLADPDAHVVRSALLALSEMPPSDAAGAAVYNVLSKLGNRPDRVLADAATIAAARHDAGFLKAVFSAYGAQGDNRPAGGQPAAGERPQSNRNQPSANLFPNPSFEEGQGDQPAAWRVRTYSGRASHAWAEGGRTGKRSLRIESQQGADSSWYVDVKVEPDTEYRLSAWIKAENVTGAMGGLLNVHGSEYRTPAVTGTSDWRKVEITFNSGPQSVVSINCLFGGWGRSRGVAWYDDLELVKAPSPALAGPLGRAVSIVTTNYARRAPADSVVATLASLKDADPALASAVMEGLSRGWPEGQAPKLSDADAAALRSLAGELPAQAREQLVVLAERWGRKDLVAGEIAKLADDLRKRLADTSAGTQGRLDAARRLVALADDEKSVAAILKLVTPTAPPQVQVGFVEALGQSQSPGTGQSIVAKWPTFTPSAQAAALGVLLRRPAWTAALLDAVESGAINAKDLRAQDWQVLKANPDGAIASRAKTLEQAKGREPSADKKKLLDALLPLAAKGGDPAVGQAVFVKNCQVCHTLEGQGGKVGPDLTGVGARPTNELLAEIIDPNRSVEGTYRQWVVQTRDGNVLAGRLLSESRTSVELIDATAKTYAIEREDIKQLRASDLSVMPEGFEQLPPDELAALIQYLSQSKVKH